MVYHKIIISTCLLFSCSILQALDLEDTTIIIDEASIATQELQQEFSGLIELEEEEVFTTIQEQIEEVPIGAIATEVIEIRETNLSTPEISNLELNNSTIRCTKGANVVASENNDTEEEEEEIEGSTTKGLVIFKTRLKVPCKMNGEEFAKNYTQEDWEDIYDSKEFEKVVVEICPKMEGRYKERWTPHLFQFSVDYASDSDNIPEC